MTDIWVCCERAADGVRAVAYELLGVAKRLAGQIKGGHVTAVAIGALSDDAAADLCACGADRVLVVDGDGLLPPEEMRHADELSSLMRAHAPEIALFGATAFGRGIAPRVAARLRAGLTADCTELDIDPTTGLLLQTRPAFGGNLLATISTPSARPQMATVRPKVFARPEPDASRPVRIERVSARANPSPIAILERIDGAASVNIGDFDVLVSVGVGIGGAENIRRAQLLAERLGGTLAASRPMVDAGLVPYARQVGQTGKAVAPKLYLALGISGAIQHMAGVGAGTLVAVNADADAPIFEHAHYGLRMDCGAFLDEMLERTMR